MKKFFSKLEREVSRPFEYASKAGEVQKEEESRMDIGGDITKLSTKLICQSIETIDLSASFENYLAKKELSEIAVGYFSPLKYIGLNKQQKMEFIMNTTDKEIDKVGVAVYRSEVSLRVSIVRVIHMVTKEKSTVEYNKPQTIVNYVERNYGYGTRKSNRYNQTIDRKLSPAEQAKITQDLRAESNKKNLGEVALNALNKKI